MQQVQAGEIFVEGLGTVEIQGDVPTDEESRAIVNAISNAEDDGDPLVTAEPPEPEPELPPIEGPLGLMPTEARGKVRSAVEGQPGLVQLISELSPSAIGTAVGATLTAPVPIPGARVAGGIIGGGIGELLAQETGVAPRSDLNLALSAGGPLIGSTVGKTFQLLRRGAGTGFAKGFPAARTARGRNLAAGAIDEFESLGTTILASKSGLMARSADALFKAMRKGRIRIKPDQTTSTSKVIDDVTSELDPVSAIPEVGQAITAMKRVSAVMLNNPSGVLLDEFVRARSFLGGIIGRLEAQGGIKVGAAKRIFAAMSDDLERFASSPFRRGSQARLAKAGVARAKLEFAVKDLEAAVAKFTRDAPEVPGAVSINFKGLQQWLRNITNKKSAQFDKNFTSALVDELPDLKERIKVLAELVTTGSPGGPGSIVLRGQAAKIGRAFMGGALGFLGSGGSAVGAAAGGLIFAQFPEMLVSILTTRAGARFLEMAAKAGRGQINQRAWQTAFEIALRAGGETNERVRREVRQREMEQEGRVPLTAREATRRILKQEDDRVTEPASELDPGAVP